MGKQKVQKQKMMVKAKTSIKRTVKKTKHKRDELEKNRPAKRHSPDKYRDTDAPATKTNQYTSNLPPSNKHVGVDKLRQFHSLVTHTIPGCDTDDLRSLCSDVSHVHDREWSLEKLKNAPADIIRVQSLVSHLMLVGLSTTDCTTDALDADSDDVDDPDDSGDELTDAERTLDVLHDQCHAMLKGLQHHLDLLFRHFKYRSHTDDH